MAGFLMGLTSILMFISSSDSSQLVPESLIISSFQESLQMVSDAFNKTAQRLDLHPSPSQMYRLSRRPSAETQQVSRSAEIFQTTLTLLKEKTSRRQRRSVQISEVLSVKAVERIANLSGCPRTFQSTTCATDEEYRSITGVCNNRKNPFWGSANTGLARWLPAEYEDGENQPKGWNAGRQYNGFQLPPVREVSKRIIRSSSSALQEDRDYSQMLVDWGQYIDHDISFTPQSSSQTSFTPGFDCLRTCVSADPCFPIQISRDDPLSRNSSCLPFFRSSPSCTGLQRQQLNSITSFIDASTVYGSSEEQQQILRNSAGLLAVSDEFWDTGRPFLPSVPQRPSACLQQPGSLALLEARVECFAAGDSRVNEVLPLAVLHTLWMREHNRLAELLVQINTHWGKQRVYQETRKIIGALHQIFTMRDYIPKVIGQDSVNEFLGPYEGYNELNQSFQEDERYETLTLQQSFFSPWRLVREGGLDPVLRALLSAPAVLQDQEHLMTEELTERLLVLNVPQNLDLAALNLQRGRDHGLPGYNAWRVFCGLDRVESRSDLLKLVGSDDLVEEIMDLYGHPDNVDVWLGGLLERPLSGARTGPLFSCLIGKQMKKLRDGDRFWWENPGVFSPEQRHELQTHSLSRVICDNSGLTEVPLDAFRRSSYPEDFHLCGSVPTLDLEAWREQPDDAAG
ncbi:thyroid peroxidase isoform X3 [Danio rerio]|uniref:Thyroid peroxidase isoform X3 n=1 Tax=Danio rerio TaxID=7955 RepID=A0AC58HQ61_DANRE